MLELIIGDGKSDIKTYTYHFLKKGNIKYKTAVPFHYFQIPLQELHREVKNNNVGIINYDNENMGRAHIINAEIKYLEGRRNCFHNAYHWDICEFKSSKFIYTHTDYNDIVSLAVYGFRGSFDYLGNPKVDVLFWVPPCNDDTAEGKLMKHSRNIFEEYPNYFYQIMKNTKKSLVVRYPKILNHFPMSLSSHPMLEPLEYMLQEIYQNRYVLEKGTDDTGNEIDVRVPVVRFWDSENSEPQYYTYEYHPMRHRKVLIDEFAEIKLNKVDAEKVKQGSDLFIIDNMF